MANIKKSVEFLPTFFQSDKNAKFLSSTLDQFIQSPELERIDGWVGTTDVSTYKPVDDTYISELTPIRAQHQLSPSLILKNELGDITNVITYEDLINEIKNQGGYLDKLSYVLQSLYDSYDPLINWDKLINYDQYYWLSSGPDPILVNNNPLNFIGQSTYLLSNGKNLANGMKITFTTTYTNGTISISSGTEYIVEGVGDYIRLVDFNLLEPNGDLSTTFNEVFDNSGFDTFPFDSDKKLAIDPEYVTINISSQDLNPWSRYNRWVHIDVLKTTAELNGTDFDLSLATRASRPIVEFSNNLQLFNFGKVGIKNVDLIDTTTVLPLEEIPGNIGYYIDGVEVQHGYRIIFNATRDLYARNKIYKVVFDVDIITLEEDQDSPAEDSSSVSINYGVRNSGKSYHYKTSEKSWVESQQKTSLNQAPLFDLFDENGISFADKTVYSSDFTGNKIFGYAVGQGAPDSILGFPVKQTSTEFGVGSFLFQNYYSTDTFNLVINRTTYNKPVNIGYYKFYNYDEINPEILYNVFSSVYATPLTAVEKFVTTSSSISTFESKAFVASFSTSTLVKYGSVNQQNTSFSISTANNKVYYNFNESIPINSSVIVKTISSNFATDYSFYETPINLTNNPLNENFDYINFPQLADQFASMTTRSREYLVDYTGFNPDAASFGSTLNLHQTPISLPLLFLASKKHNLIDSIRFVANQYAQWRFQFLQFITDYTDQVDPVTSVDEILVNLSKSKFFGENFYRSDMAPFGLDKTIRKVVVASSSFSSYPLGLDFSLTELSFKAVLVYKNNEQLVYGLDYTFNSIDGLIEFLINPNVDDYLEFHIYNNTLGNCIPPTPTKLGMFPKYIPQFITDDRYSTDQAMIQCHDGSLIKAFNDYRDDLILELEKRIFNNIKVDYETHQVGENQYNIPGAFWSSAFTIDEYNNLLSKEFFNWTNTYNVDWSTNESYDANNWKTYNFSQTTSTVSTELVSGNWRSLFHYFYDTDRPHTHPWEMLGFSIEPSWWKDIYGSAPYTSNNTLLWQDLEAGYVRGEIVPSSAVNRYSRPNLSNIIPVDSSGNLRDPLTFLITGSTVSDYKDQWKFGDFGPAEVSWRHSSFYPFAVNIVSALLYPNFYLARFFDSSRMTYNYLGRLTYEKTNYIDPRILKLDGYQEQQTAGYVNLIIEKGIYLDSNYRNLLAQDLKYLTFNLTYKLGGYTTKEKLQIKINAVDPESTSPGLILPPEDFTLYLNQSRPIKKLTVSGIIVEKSGSKFIVRGYDRANPYFTIFKPILGNNSSVIKIGGKNEDYVLWQPVFDTKSNLEIDNTNKFYKIGQIVYYENNFYRVTISHVAQSTFNPSLFARLSELPTKGGVRISSSTRFENLETVINYNTAFSSVQEVYDIIIGYGHWLKSQGFVFDYYNQDMSEVIDWYFSGKEFAFWSTHNWADGNIITLSPFADVLKIESTSGVVDNLFANGYEYSLQKADGQAFPKEYFSITRLEDSCVIKTKNTEEGIYFALLYLIQKEHVIVLNNTTIFNDTIYDMSTGYRQKRIRLTGFRTKNWNGNLTSPGFFYDKISIESWYPYKTYYPSQIVIFNGLYYSAEQIIINDNQFDFSKWKQLNEKPISELLPNFDYKISQFEDFYSLDIDNFDTGQQLLAQHLIGYTPRTYLNKLITDKTAQYKFYQGFIRDKGTKKSLDNLTKIGINRDYSSIEIKEQWAFRVGTYGSHSTFKELEFSLVEGSYLENPYLSVLTNTPSVSQSGIVHYTSSTDILIAPVDFVITSTFITLDGTFLENNLSLTTAGYVKLDDVTTTAYSKNSLLDIANNSIIQDGNTIWLGFLENGDWTVYRYTNQQAKITGVFVSSPGAEITFVTDSNHLLEIGDIISVIRFNNQVDGIYIVSKIEKSNQFSVSSTLSGIVNEPLLSYGSLYKFETVRYNNYESLSSSYRLFNFQYGSKIWVDSNENSKWTVLEKIQNYDTANEFNGAGNLGKENFGYSIKSSENVVLVSSIDYHFPTSYNYGRVNVYRILSNQRITKQFDFPLNSKGQVYCQTNTSTEFGYALDFDEGKNLYIVGAPAASKIRATLSTSTIVAITSSTYLGLRDNVSEGMIKISTRNNWTNEIPKYAFAQPYVNTSTLEHSRFGHSIYINKVSASTSTTLLVGAPGNMSYNGTGTVFAYKLNLVTGNVNVEQFSTNLYKVSSTSSVILNVGAKWGYSISGDSDGNSIAISAPLFYNGGSTGVVQIFDKNLLWKQTIESPFNNNDEFGTKVKISATGKFLAVSSIKSLSSYNTYGSVALYKKNTNGFYEIAQILYNPEINTDLKFGQDIDISPDESTMVISSLGTNRSEFLRFYENQVDLLGETTFDNGETRFVNIVSGSGSVYTYNNLGDYFVQADQLTPTNIYVSGKYGNSVSANNKNIFVGAPYENLSEIITDVSKFYQFKKIDNSINTWKVVGQQDSTVDVDVFQRVALIDTEKEELIEYLDLFDPVKGRIPGLAEQELKYKSTIDPAIYSIGISRTMVDTNNSWIDDHIGELWWDLSTVKYLWYEQGNEVFRKNNWGKLFPGATIDVYEWVKSEYLPSEWSTIAGTSGGAAKGITGQPKYPDNSVVSVKQILNTITGAFENVYYYWVKNKVTLPNIKSRKITAYDISRIISDPLSYGLKYAMILSKNSLAFSNIQNELVGKKISVNISFDSMNNKIPRHTEWLLLNEGDVKTMPTDLLNKKLIDSFLGRDNLGNLVPNPNLTFRQKYGLGIRPQQTLFKNRFEALRNCFGYVNTVLAENSIVGKCDFTLLNDYDAIPDESLGEYDILIDDYSQLSEISTDNFIRGQLTCDVYNGKIIRVNIVNPGFGYFFAPTVTVVPNEENKAVIKTIIDSSGRIIDTEILNSGYNFINNPIITVREHVVVVGSDINSGGKWASYKFNYMLSVWTKFKTQLYNTPLYWNYVDYVSSKFNSFKSYRYVLNNTFEINGINEINNGDYVKILNSGNGSYIILEKTINGDFSRDYDLVYNQNGTIELSQYLWNNSSNVFSYDNVTLDESLYDQLPDTELSNIFYALKDNIFINDLKKYWNLFFFKAVKYSLTEQKILDWAFKTSFITVYNSIDYFSTSTAYSLDKSSYIEDYVSEVKPFRTKIVGYSSVYENVEDAKFANTDFDLPSYYNTETSELVVPQHTVGNTTSSIFYSYPWKDWTDNYTYSIKEIVISNGGQGYVNPPAVSFVETLYPNASVAAEASAYIKDGAVYKVEIVTNIQSSRPFKIVFTGGGPISMGGNPTLVARASVILKNEKVRKNIVGLKFDRYSRTGEIGSIDTIYTTSTNGLNYDYVLPYHADSNKFDIIPTLDKKLILISDYNIVDFTDSSNNKVSKFVFKNYLPESGKTLKIEFKKNITLFNAVDRINNYYNPTSTMPGQYLPILMTGLEYPERNLKGLKFEYTMPLLSTGTQAQVYGNGGAWNDDVSYYSRAKIVSYASSSTTTLYLNTTSGIVPGQKLNFLNTAAKKVRTDTVVLSIITATSAITISSPVYGIKQAAAYSTSTIAGSVVLFETTSAFYGTLRAGDVIEISNLSPGYNGITTITTITGNSTFFALAPGNLSTSSLLASSTSQVRAYSLLEDIYPQNRLIGNYNTFIGNCIFPSYNLTSCSPSMMEGYTATWTLNGTNIDFGLGRTFQYTISGTGIDSADFVGGLTGTITTSALSLPLTFYTTSTINVDTINPETFRVDVRSWLTTSSPSTKVVASGIMKLRDRPTGMAQWTILAKDLIGNPVTTVNEGDIVRFYLSGSNIDFASDGVAVRVTATGINITTADVIPNTLESGYIRIYSEDEFPVVFDIEFAEDRLTEGTEYISIGVDISTVTNCTIYSTTITTTVTTITILDTSITPSSVYSLESLTPNVVEGTTATFRLKTFGVPIGTSVPFTITGTITVSDLNTTTYSGSFVLVDGGTINPGGQYADVSYNVSSDAATTGYDPNEYVWIRLTGNTSNTATIYITDQLSQVYGNASVYGYSVNGETAYSRIRIRSTGTFDFAIYDEAQYLSTKPSNGTQIWAVNTSLSNYYVRGIIEPTTVWNGNVQFTGPGFSTLNYSNLTSGPVFGSWVTVNTAESATSGWNAQAIADSVNQTSASGQFNLTIQISKTSGGTVISQGTYDCLVYSDITPTSGGAGGGGSVRNDNRELL